MREVKRDKRDHVLQPPSGKVMFRMSQTSCLHSNTSFLADCRTVLPNCSKLTSADGFNLTVLVLNITIAPQVCTSLRHETLSDAYRSFANSRAVPVIPPISFLKSNV